jgi:hypothetical protein
MKTSTQTSIILKAIDLELKAILLNDLKKFKTTKNNQEFIKQLLMAA